jgi:hypothetical protein
VHWSWYLIFGYWAFGATGWIVVIKLFAKDLEDPRFWRVLMADPLCGWIVLVLAAVIVGPLFPLAMAHCAWKCWSASWSERREWEKFRRTFRPTEFEALHPANLPTEAQKHFEQCALIFKELGFVPVVTCRVKPEPRPVLALCLLGQEGAVQAEACWIWGTPGASFISVLEDGHVLDTACVEESLPPDEIDAINRSGCFTTQMFEVGAGGNIADEAFLLAAYRSHLERLAELEERLGCGTLHLSAEQIPDLKRYENAVFGQLKFDRGKFDNRPQPQPCPQGIARRINTSGAECGVASEALARATG